MKIYVFTNGAGKVIGSYQPNPNPPANTPTLQPTPSGTSCRVHELEVPDRLCEITSADELHRELVRLVAAKNL